MISAQFFNIILQAIRGAILQIRALVSSLEIGLKRCNPPEDQVSVWKIKNSSVYWRIMPLFIKQDWVQIQFLHITEMIRIAYFPLLGNSVLFFVICPLQLPPRNLQIFRNNHPERSMASWMGSYVPLAPNPPGQLVATWTSG